MAPFLDALRESEVDEVVLCARAECREAAAAARAAGAHVLVAEGPLAVAVNRAVRYARGAAVWFLHPACRPARGLAGCVLAGLAEAEAGGGWFRVREAEEGGPRAAAFRANRAADWLGRTGWRHGPYLPGGSVPELAADPDGDAALARVVRLACGGRAVAAPVRLGVVRPGEARGPDLS
jgi:hypothetical protein